MGDILNAIPPEDLARLGLALLVMVAGYRIFLVRRKGPKGEKLSALLVPGWHYDNDVDAARAETVRVTRFYETQLADLRKQTETRVGEVRGYRDEALATNAQLLENLTSATRDLAVIIRILDELAEGDRREPPDARG